MQERSRLRLRLAIPTRALITNGALETGGMQSVLFLGLYTMLASALLIMVSLLSLPLSARVLIPAAEAASLG